MLTLDNIGVYLWRNRSPYNDIHENIRYILLDDDNSIPIDIDCFNTFTVVVFSVTIKHVAIDEATTMMITIILYYLKELY